MINDFIKIEKQEYKQVVFTGCGGMIAYYFGIAKFLQENYNLDNIIFGGVSGGSIIALFLNKKENIDTIKKYWDEMLNCINDCKTGSLFNTLDILRNILSKYINDKKDDDFFKNLNYKYFVSISGLYLEKKNIHFWYNNDDLIESIISSCSLPLLGKNLVNEFRESYCLDGVFLNNYPVLYKELPIFYITPFKFRSIINPSWFYIYGDMDWFLKLYEIGYNDAIENKSVLDEFFL